MASFTRAPELTDICQPAVAWLDDITVVDHDPQLDAELTRVEQQLRSQAPVDGSAVRAMYKRIGLDPTKTRPSSEALVRRVRRGDPLPRVNTLVDICNWCSAELQLPYGLYDAAHVAGAVTLRLGRPGESYPGIRKDDVHVAGRLTLADERGPFGNPTSDSARTMVTPSTRHAMVVVFAPRDVTTERLRAVLDLTTSRMTAYVGGRERERWLP